MSEKMNSRVVSISSFSASDLNNLPEGIKLEDQTKWIVIKWFNLEDYETQESLNDASEIYADDISRDLSRGHLVKIENVIRKEDSTGHLTGFEFEMETFIHKNTI